MARTCVDSLSAVTRETLSALPVMSRGGTEGGRRELIWLCLMLQLMMLTITDNKPQMYSIIYQLGNLLA